MGYEIYINLKILLSKVKNSVTITNYSFDDGDNAKMRKDTSMGFLE